MSAVYWLYAVGKNREHKRWVLGEDELLVGRAAVGESAAKLSVPWDRSLSRSHLVVARRGDCLRVRRLPSAANPIFHRGTAAEEFQLGPGEHFVAGQTEFQFGVRELGEAPAAAQEFTLAWESRENLREKLARDCLIALTRLLPRLRKAGDEAGLWRAAVQILQSLLPGADLILALDVDLEGMAAEKKLFFKVLSGAASGEEAELRLDYGLARPSRKLLGRAFESGETALHLWAQQDASVTMMVGTRWALAAPVGEAHALYAVGSGQGVLEQPGRQEQVLVDLVAEAVSHHRSAHELYRIEAQVGQFFSPGLRALLWEQDFGQLLAPKKRQITVLFFDLRGFSRATEQAEDDVLDSILVHHARLTEVMTLVTDLVFEYEGTVIDYAGDAVMACWGAPLEQADHALRAVRAGRKICEAIHAMDLPFGDAGMRCGIGIATGEAIAGQVGGKSQLKYGLMGAVVNQASRLEGLTKYVGALMLVTGQVQSRLPEAIQVRRVGHVCPAGMEQAVDLWEIPLTRRDADTLQQYADGLACFEFGNLKEARRLVEPLVESDPVARFLHSAIEGGQSEGVIRLDRK